MKLDHLVLFDFDGTLTTRDTLFEFCKFYAGEFKFAIGMLVLSPVLAAHRLRFITAHCTKEIFLSYFIGGIPSHEFEELCQKFANHLKTLIRSKAMAEIEIYQRQNARMIIVSASPENWIIPWAKAYHIEVIATRLQVVGNKMTGKILGKNCNGVEKVNRILQILDPSNYKQISAYGDTSGDLPMLGIAHHRFFKPFRGNN